MNTQTTEELDQVEVRIGDVALAAEVGQSLLGLCDWNLTPLQFCCRAGSCGTCLIRVVDGMENLSEVTDNELILLPELTEERNARLACQVRIFGPVSLIPGSLIEVK
jgi:ferredoxin